MKNLLTVIGMLIASITTGAAIHSAHAATDPKLIEIKGEVIDTWCFFSGVMGGEDAVVGSAHHTCALWCAAGGIPVGVLTEEGEVYMVLKIKGEEVLAKSDTIMEIQSDAITAKGMHYVRDGVNYIVVEDIVANDGITYINHEDYGGTVPPNAFPKKKK